MNPGSQASQANSAANIPAIQVVQAWGPEELLNWIQKKLKIPLDPEDVASFLDFGFDGEAFLTLAGRDDYFKGVGISPLGSLKLAGLAKEITSSKSKCCRSTVRTPYIMHVTRTPIAPGG
jgi:hypothetical protein